MLHPFLMNFAEIRSNYSRGQLAKADLHSDPIEQFHLWMKEAADQGVIEPTAMSLATAGADGHPLLRTVLLKGLDARGFVFFTNLDSRKGRQIAENGHVALLFPWLLLERQVIVTGPAERVSNAEALEYFRSRPRASQVAAWASRQSTVISSRKMLEMEWEKMNEKFGEGEIPLPSDWGGYRVKPLTIEFWQGRRSRLHDRFQYTAQPDETWRLDRLSP